MPGMDINKNWNGVELLLKPSTIKEIIKQSGKRSSKEFLQALNMHVHKKLQSAIACHNGGKKTLDQEVAAWCGLKG